MAGSRPSPTSGSSPIPSPPSSPEARSTRVVPFFEALLGRDGGGGSWLGPLLRAAPHGPRRFGELADEPGFIEAPVVVHTQSGLRGAFEYRVAPPRGLLRWFVDHPEALAAAPDPDASPETVRLRRALIDDDPPGARARAQDRAHDLLRASPPLAAAWWRFEEPATLHCALITNRLALVVQGRAIGDAAPATPWYPARSALVRDLEAAERLSEGKPWGVLVISDAPAADATDAAVRDAVAAGAPQLDESERAALRAGYLGNLTWPQAAAAVDLPFAAPPVA